MGMVGEFVTPLFIGYIIDAIIELDYDQVNEYVIIWCCFNVFGSFIQGCQKYLFAMLTERIGYEIRRDVFKSIITKDC